MTIWKFSSAPFFQLKRGLKMIEMAASSDFPRLLEAALCWLP
jgi:hypothetical protein